MKIVLRIVERENMARELIGGPQSTFDADVLGPDHIISGCRSRLCLPGSLAYSNDPVALETKARHHLMAFGFAAEDIAVERKLL